VLWLLDPPRRAGSWRLAVASGLAGAGVGLLVNQLITHLWERPRPYASSADIIAVIPPSHDPSFPSDHATAAFGIAVGVFLVRRDAGRVLLAWAALIGLSRVLAGMHYPSDVLAGALVGAVSAVVVARVARRPLEAAVRVVSRATDPPLDLAARLRPVSQTVGSPEVRRAAVALAGAALLGVFACAMRDHLLDEMPLGVLGAWTLIVALAAMVAGRSAIPHLDQPR
jgi:undecaprenyl-diphosphatase